MPARRLLAWTTVFFTARNFTYSHSPRTNKLLHSMYSKPRPPVQPATKALVLCSASVCDCAGTTNVAPMVVVVLPRLSVVVTSSRLVTVLVTERETSIAEDIRKE